jgi:hypothetical protein
VSQLTVDNPGGLVLDDALLGGFGGFPDSLFVISVGNGKFAANNATLTDGQSVNGLACFPTEDDANHYMGLLGGLSGEIVPKSFDEAREIALSKPILSCLFLFQFGKIVEVHWVR